VYEVRREIVRRLWGGVCEELTKISIISYSAHATIVEVGRSVCEERKLVYDMCTNDAALSQIYN
jgi:hypothetical protein